MGIPTITDEVTKTTMQNDISTCWKQLRVCISGGHRKRHYDEIKARLSLRCRFVYRPRAPQFAVTHAFPHPHLWCSVDGRRRDGGGRWLSLLASLRPWVRSRFYFWQWKIFRLLGGSKPSLQVNRVDLPFGGTQPIENVSDLHDHRTFFHHHVVANICFRTPEVYFFVL